LAVRQERLAQRCVVLYHTLSATAASTWVYAYITIKLMHVTTAKHCPTNRVYCVKYLHNLDFIKMHNQKSSVFGIHFDGLTYLVTRQQITWWSINCCVTCSVV